MRFASFFSGWFITAIVVNPPERKLAKRTSVQCTAMDWYSGHSESTGRKTATSHLCAIMYYVFFLNKIFGLPQTLVIIRKIIFSLKSCPLLLIFYGSTFHMKQRWHCCQSCIRRTCGPQERPLRTDLKQTEATLLLLWSWNSSIMWPQWGQKLFEAAFEYLCSTPMITV